MNSHTFAEKLLDKFRLGSIWNYSRLAIHPRGTISDKGR